MKQLFFILLLVVPVSLWAADSEITNLPANTTVNDADLIVQVDDVGGTPTTKKMTVVDLFDTINTFSKLDTICADEALVNKADGAVWAGVHDYGSATSFEIVNTADCSGFTTEGQICWDSDNDLLYVGDGAAAILAGGHGNGANCAAGEIPLGVDASGAVEGCYEPTLNDVENPTASKTFGMGPYSLIFNFVNTSADHAFELNGTGNFSKDLFHAHQHTGNPTNGRIAVFEWEDEDIGGVVIQNNSPGATSGNNQVGLLITTDDDDDTDWVPFRVADDSGGNDDTLYTSNSVGLFFVLTGFDGIGAVDLDYGSGDITDHTFITNSTGNAEIVFPDDSIGPAEIDSTTGAYDFGGVTSFEIPNGTSPTVDATGEIAIDSNIFSSAQGSVIAYDGTQQINGVFTTDTPSDGETPIFDSDTGTVKWDTPVGAGDVTGVGDCADGDCLDGTSDGGTQIALYDGDSNKVTISSGNLSGDITMVLPTDDGDNNDFLQTNGSGTLAWTASAPSDGFRWVLEPQKAKLPTSNPMVIDGGNNRWRGLYDDTTDECAEWGHVLRPYNGGALSAQILYTLETTSSSDVVEFELSIMCVTGGSPEGDAQDVDSDSFGSIDNISSGSITSTAGRLVLLTDASLNGDSCAEEDLIIVKICRDADDTDTTADDVELRGVTIYE